MIFLLLFLILTQGVAFFALFALWDQVGALRDKVDQLEYKVANRATTVHGRKRPGGSWRR